MKKVKSLLALSMPIFLLLSFKTVHEERKAEWPKKEIVSSVITPALHQGFSITQSSKKMTIEKEIIVNQSIEKAWKVLGTDFAKADQWASAVKHSEGKGASFNGATCSERTCEIASMGKTQEKLLQFSNENHSLSYQVAGMPSMVKSATNSWQLTALGEGQTKLHMRMDIQVGGLMGAMMKPMMKMKMSKMGNELVEEFKFYVEKGQPHPRKVKALKKA